MAIYTIQGANASAAYDVRGTERTTLYNISGNTVWNKTTTPTEPVKRYNTFSVLGDSYSSFKGYVYPDTNKYYYPRNGVELGLYTQMWWYLFQNGFDITLDKCNGYSGSPVAHNSKWQSGDTANTFIGRCTNLGNPDLIIIFGGTNDAWQGISVGSPNYSSWTSNNKSTFAGACVYVINTIKNTYPNADILWICNTVALGAGSSDAGHSYYTVLHNICSHYKIPCVDVHPEGNMGVETDDPAKIHPNIKGQKQIYQAVINQLGSNIK